MTALVVALVAIGCRGLTGGAPPDRAEALQLAQESLARGRFDAAVEQLRPVVSEFGLDPEIAILYGRALLQNQQASLAIWPLEWLASRSDAPLETRGLLVQALSYGGGVREAIREASSFLDELPDDPIVRRLRADAYKSNLQAEEALGDLDFLIEQSPRDPLLLQAKIDLLGEMDRLDAARDVIALQLEVTQARDVVPEVAAQFCAAAARFELDHDDVKAALARSEECLERHPRDPSVVLTHFDVLDASGEEREATDFLIEQGKRNLPRFRIQYALAKRLASLDRVEEAEAVLLEAAKNVGGAQPLLALADQRVARRDLVGAAQAVVDAIRNQLGRGPGDADFDWKSIPAEALFAFGDVFISAEDYAHAEEIVAVLDEEAYALLLQARLALAKGDPRRALETYERAFPLWPGNSGARYLAGVAAMKLGEFDRAMSFYQDALRADAQVNDAGIVLARMQRARGYPGAAVDTLEIFLRKHEDHPQAIREFSSAAMAAGLFSYGESGRARLSEDPEWAGFALADHARDISRVRGPEEARGYLEASGDLFEATHYEALWTWVEISSALGRFDEAARRVEQLHAKHPEAAGFAIALARVHALRGEPTEARALLEPVVGADAGRFAAQLDLGKALVAEGDVDAAVARFDHADRLDPLDPEPAFLAALALEQDGRASEALARLERFIPRHPWHAQALVAAARLKAAAGDRGETTRNLALQARYFLGALDDESLPALAHVLADVERPAEAIEIFTRAVAAGRATASDRYRFARLLIEQGQREAAEAELDAIIAGPAFPEVEAARSARAELSASDEG